MTEAAEIRREINEAIQADTASEVITEAAEHRRIINEVIQGDTAHVGNFNGFEQSVVRPFGRGYIPMPMLSDKKLGVMIFGDQSKQYTAEEVVDFAKKAQALREKYFNGFLHLPRRFTVEGGDGAVANEG